VLPHVGTRGVEQALSARVRPFPFCAFCASLRLKPSPGQEDVAARRHKKHKRETRGLTSREGRSGPPRRIFDPTRAGSVEGTAPRELRRLAGTLALAEHGQDARATLRWGRRLDAWGGGGTISPHDASLHHRGSDVMRIALRNLVVLGITAWLMSARLAAAEGVSTRPHKARAVGTATAPSRGPAAGHSTSRKAVVPDHPAPPASRTAPVKQAKVSTLPVPAEPARPAAVPKGWAKVEQVTVSCTTEQGPKPVPLKYYINSLGMRFVLVRPGRFMMGAPEDERGRNDDEAPHAVEIVHRFFIGATEVATGDWRRFVKESGYNWNHFSEVRITSPTDAHPISFVSWQDAVAFCEWLSRVDKAAYRLPTEAEWEYACRAGSVSRYIYGDKGDSKLMGYFGRSTTAYPVGSFPPNRWGLYDTHGNVWEWCGDWYDAEYYGGSPTTAPSGPAQGDARAVRGGSWQDRADYCRSANRSGRWPGGRYEDLGFRVVRTER
jgi:formylglycine-generating enzyme required for sulfatase activity